MEDYLVILECIDTETGKLYYKGSIAKADNVEECLQNNLLDYIYVPTEKTGTYRYKVCEVIDICITPINLSYNAINALFKFTSTGKEIIT